MKKIILFALLVFSAVLLPVKLFALDVSIGDRMYISAEGEKKSVKVGDTLELTANYLEVVSQNTTWKSSDTSVLTVDSNGKVKGVSNGSAFVIATSSDNRYLDVYNLTVIKGDVSTGKRMYIEASSNSVQVGNTLALTAKFLETPSQDVKWESLNSSVASVDNSGLVKGVSTGNAVIKATSADKSMSYGYVVKVNGNAISTGAKIVINTPNNSQILEVNEKMQLTVSFLEMPSQNVTWTSSNNSVVSVDANGLITGVSEGSAVITATSADQKYFNTITINVGKKMSIQDTTNNGDSSSTSDNTSEVNNNTDSQSKDDEKPTTSENDSQSITNGGSNIADNEPNFIADHKTLLIIIGLVVLLALCGALWYLSVKGKNK